ncbi:3-carboxy-cis,cis-muconate cycloisomerase [Taklimakanibacter deserti]|uniref:3-carboxy-cis,cis-muconate cycloisomerase n=1 Tax=Taklimakanibacter deserti TaxID=2267839 RepID=UPI000E657E69
MTQALHEALWRDEEISRLFSAEAELAAMLDYEVALAKAQAESGLITPDAASAICRLRASFIVDRDKLLSGIKRDGMAVPELVRQLRDALPESHRDALHLRSTSQDVIDTALTLRLKPVLALYEKRLNNILAAIDRLDGEYGALTQMGRTRMQRALPVRVSDRLATWRTPLKRHLDRLAVLAPHLLVLQTGGPVGIDRGPWVAALGRELDLGVAPEGWQTARDNLAEFASWLSLVSGTLGKIGQDIALMAQNEIGEVKIEGAGTSSAMHHKQNPVQAELLVAMARFNATQVSGIHHALIHEQERSGAAWALEWMILPGMIETTAAALAMTTDLLGRIRFQAGK